jgi:hypothetical protein
MALLSAADIAAARASLEVLLTHTYQRTAVSGGAEDDWGDEDTIPSGSATTGIPCTYTAGGRVVRGEDGVTRISGPTLMVSATDPLAVGDTVGVVTDQLGVVLDVGPLRVERLMDDASGLGASLIRVFELRSIQAAR